MELQPGLLEAAKRQALEEGKTLKAFVEDALAAHLGRPKVGAFRLRPLIFTEPQLQIPEGWEEMSKHLYPYDAGGGPNS